MLLVITIKEQNCDVHICIMETVYITYKAP